MNILPSMRDWYERHKSAWVVEAEPILRQRSASVPSSDVKPAKAPKSFSPVADLERRAIAAISPSRVTYCPGTAAKRFARQIQGATQLTDKQRAYVWAVVWKFRRQVRDKSLVEHAKRIGGCS